MRELERNAADTNRPTPAAAGPSRIAIVGAGRVGRALAAGLRRAGYEVDGPAARGEFPTGDALILCVPDSQIEAAAEAHAGAAPLVGHTSGATPLTALDPAGAEAFGLHPLQTITGAATELRGAGCGIAG